jgi:putative mRNA 3-end processing factor
MVLSRGGFSAPLIGLSDRGLYCEVGGFHIDPHRAVNVAVITHAHSDHARRGSGIYYCAQTSVRLLHARLGKKIQVVGVPYGETFRLGGAELSFHPAGHILGSAQVRVRAGGETWVASGDYKRDPDPSCEPFEVVRCDTFITEATFGTPKYLWPKDCSHGRDIYNWWQRNARQGLNTVVFGYSLGKAQRILAELEPFAQKPVIIHETMAEITQCYRDEGRKLAPTVVFGEFAQSASLQGELILAPPSAMDLWSSRIGRYVTAFASGWMQGSGGYGRGSYDHGFVLSDHADWEDLNRTIDDSGALRVFVQHRAGALVRALRSRGIDAHPETALASGEFERLEPKNLSLF